MAVRRSAGLLLHRRGAAGVEVLLGHMGGPFWARRDEGGWSIPKGEYDADERPLDAARREFTEELGLPVPAGEPVELGEVRQGSGKLVTVWAIAADLDLAGFTPGTFEMERPKGSGRTASFPEIDRVQWLDVAAARTKLVGGQRAFLDRLADVLAAG